MRFGEAFLELTPTLNQGAVRQAEQAASTAGQRAGRAYGGGFDKGAERAGAFGTALATIGAKATIGVAGLAAITPATLQLTAALVPAAGAAIALPGALLGLKAAGGVARLAVLGVSDAIDKGFTGTAKEAEEALSKLPPEARQFSRSIIGLKDDLKTLQGSVSDRFFDPINEQFDPFVNRYLPLANRELPLMSQALGATSAQFAKAATEGNLFNGVSAVFQNTTRAITTGNDSIRDLSDGIGSLLVVSSSSLPKLAEGFDQAAGATGRYLVEAEKTGKLEGWMNAGFTAVSKLFDIFKNLASVVSTVLQSASRSSGDFLGTIVSLTAKLAAFFKTAEGSKALDNFFTITGAISSALRQGLMVILPQIGTTLAILAPAVQPLIAAFVSLIAAVAPLLPVAAKLAVVVAKVLAGAIATLAATLTPLIAKMTGGGSAGEGMERLLASAEKLGPAINDAAGNVESLAPALNLTATAIAFVVNNTDTFVKLLPFIVAGFVAWKVAQLAANVAMAASVPIRIAEIVATRQQTAALAQLAAAQGIATGATTLNSAATSTNATMTVRQRVAAVASAAAQKAVAIATGLWTAAQKLLNLALRANPIGIVVTAIAALIAILVIAYKNNETFRDIVNKVWAAIKQAIGATVDWFVKTAWPALKAAIQALGDFFSWLWKNAIVPAWNGIKAAIDAAWKAIKIIFDAVTKAVQALAKIFEWLWKNIIVPVWQGIKLAIEVNSKIIQLIFGTIEVAVRAMAKLFEWFWKTIIVNVWNGIKTVIQTTWNFIRDSIFTPLMNFIKGPVTAMWKAFQLAVSLVWTAIKTAIQTTWNFIRDSILTPLMNFVKGPVTAMWTAYKNAVSTLWTAIKTAIQTTWNAIRDTILTPLMNFVKGPVTTMWNNFRTAVANVWTAIKNAISTAWNAIRDTILNPLINFIKTTLTNAWVALKNSIATLWGNVRTLLNDGWTFIRTRVFDALVNGITKTIPNAFNTGVAAIKRAWDAVQEAVKTPIKFVVNTVLNEGIIKGFNWISGKVGGPSIDPIRLGFKSGGVLPGYSPGRDNHSFFSPTAGRLDLSGGEAIMRPEFTRAVGDEFVHAANAVARSRGSSGVRKFLSGYMSHGDHPQFAEGGIWGGVKNIAGSIVGGVQKAWDAFTNPAETLKKAVLSLVGGHGGTAFMGDVLKATTSKLLDSVTSKITSMFDASGGALGSEGGPGKWQAMWQWVKSRFPQADLYSGLRNSTTLSGNRSLHADGRAIDFTPIRAASRAIMSTFGTKITELISPWPSEHIYKGRPHDYSDAIDRQHGVYGDNAHIHWGMKLGGIFKKLKVFDRGGWLNPGDISMNMGRKPEAVLTPDESAGLKAMATDQLVDLLEELITAVKDNGHTVGGYIRGSGKGLVTKARGV